MSVEDKVYKVFEYLQAIKNLNSTTIRDYKKYDEYWKQKDFLEYEGCYVGGRGECPESWLEVHKQEISKPPLLPEILEKWIVNWDKPENEPEKKEKIKIENKRVEYEKGGAQISFIEESEEEEYELFEDDVDRVRAYKEWYESEWRPWAEETKIKKKIKKLYGNLFSIHQRVQREGDDIEIAWGHGLIKWKTSEGVIERPLLITKMELVFDAKKAIFKLVPTSRGTILETEMLNGVEIAYPKNLQEKERGFQEVDIDVWDKEILTPVLTELVHTIHPEGKYEEENDTIVLPTSIPLITYSPVVFLRKVSGRLWNIELANLLEHIKDGYRIPRTIKNLVAEDEEELDEESNGARLDDWSQIGEDLLFPLPTNLEQKMIAQKLSKADGIVVQGPPGTGKSHTIANLICHMVAHGKRVLVTSQKDKALRVLREKIPTEIRDLCVSLVGSDTVSMKDIENSVKKIAENLDINDVDVLNKEIEHLKLDLDETRRIKAKYNKLLLEAGELENKSINIQEDSIKPIEMARWVKDNIKYNWLPDSIESFLECPLIEDELVEFFRLSAHIKSKDIESLKLDRPNVSDIPLPHIFEENVEYVKKSNEMLSESIKKIEGWVYDNKFVDEIQKNKNLFEDAIQRLEQLNEKWLLTILEECIGYTERKKGWENFVFEIRETLKKIKADDLDLLELEFRIPEEINCAVLKEDLEFLREKLLKKDKLGWLFKNFTGRRYKYIFEKITVDSLPIKNRANVEVVLKYILRNEMKKKTVLKWNRTLGEISGVQIQEEMQRFSFVIEEYLVKIEKAIAFENEVVGGLKEALSQTEIPCNKEWSNVDWLRKIREGLGVIELKDKTRKGEMFFEDLKFKLLKGLELSGSHVLWQELYDVVKNKDIEKWKEIYVELNRLEGLEGDFSRLNKLYEKLSTVAPLWADRIIRQTSEDERREFPKDWREAWKWSQQNNFLEKVQFKNQTEDLQRKFEIETKNEHRILEELVSKASWKSQYEKTKDSQKRSLFSWLKAIQRIGKGTGKYADMYRKEASREMSVCKDAIPVWIMPIQRVIENIDLKSEPFDLIIVDESSQSDLFSLCALMRAKKAVIVGDENQISPESVGTNIGDVQQLIHRYLDGIPHSSRFEVKESLYDMANMIFKSKIVLKEHFRCVPEIIQFSNDLMYQGQMIPLRMPLSSEKMEPPVQSFFVEEGYRDEDAKIIVNKPEAEAIVDFIEAICENPKYNEKTIGVVSLLGNSQSKIIEENLREVIGEEEMVRRRLICGDAYSFQGDERDVMILSMVVAPNTRIGVLNKRSDYQRFNVAASRAKDQMILFHSVELNALNPQCARYKLLQYCKNPHRVQNEIDEVNELFESRFEKEVFRIITAKGYRVIPQVKVGTMGKRIDMVIEGLKDRLAVECDGDKWHGIDKWEDDLERQRILERVGWKFWRVRGSAFYRNPAKAMEPLWKVLDEMEIETKQ